MLNPSVHEMSSGRIPERDVSVTLPGSMSRLLGVPIERTEDEGLANGWSNS